MKISVVINSRAGSVNADLVMEKIKVALFRCDLNFCTPSSFGEMSAFLEQEMQNNTDYFIICGGDGTINACLQGLMLSGREAQHIPPIALVRSGTANDLAHAMGVSHRIDQAVRNILEGQVRRIDVVEVTGDAQVSYMITNGGVGLPALIADLSNRVRSSLQTAAKCPHRTQSLKFLAEKSYGLVKKIGPSIYSLMVAEALRKWDQKGWHLEVEIPGKAVLETTSPIILVNNQPQLGSAFTPAPLTSNTDGTVNLMMSETDKISQHLSSMMHMRNGTVAKHEKIRSFELKEFAIRSRGTRPLTFFGDGEILHSNVKEIRIRCLPNRLPIVVPN